MTPEEIGKEITQTAKKLLDAIGRGAWEQAELQLEHPRALVQLEKTR